MKTGFKIIKIAIYLIFSKT